MSAPPIPERATAKEQSLILSLRDLVSTARPHQWAKNGLLFAGFVFAGRLRQPTALPEFGIVFLAFLSFCFLSSSAYVLNDILDAELDRAHPAKRYRPIPSGRISLPGAWGIFSGFMIAAWVVAGFVAALSNSAGFLAACSAYLGTTIAYSLWLKHQVIIDVMVLALGFVIRVVAGCVAIQVSISSWLILCTFNLALFMALCKRRSELLAFGDNALSVRRVLPEYSAELLNVLITIAAGSSFMAYCIYTVQAPHRDFVGGESPLLLLTILPVFVGISRYLYLVYRRDHGGKPEDLLRDPWIGASVLVWMGLAAILSRVGV